MNFEFRNENGIALIMVIIILGVVAALSSALLITFNTNIDISGDAAAENKAFYAAEGGVNYLDLKLNKFYQENIAGRSFFKADDVKEELDILQNEIDAENIEVSGFNINIDYSPHLNYENNSIYIYDITADNGEISKKITAEYEIAHLIDYFKYSRFANKVNIENSRFYDVDDHAFGTSEVLYSQWSNDSSYQKGEYVVHNNKMYISNDNFYAGEAVEPGADGWQDYWNLDNSFKQWENSRNYQEREKVVYNNEIYTSEINNNTSKPGDNNDWERNDPDLADQGFREGKVEYNQTSLPSPDDYDYQEKIIEEFKTRLKTEGGYTYEALEADPDKYPKYVPYSNYRVGDMVTYEGSVYKLSRSDTSYRAVWKKQTAAQLFLDENDSYFTKGNYVYIKGDFAPSYDEIKYFNKSEEVIHILVDGEISPQANVSLRNNANIIFYTTSDTVSFENGYITMPAWGSNINLAYFAPFATYTSDGFYGGYASSMVFNEINLKNETITSVKTYSDDNPLRGSIDPGIAELTRVHGDLNYDIDKTGPLRLNWSTN